MVVSAPNALAWQPVTDDLLVELARRSQSRISDNEDFAEVRERLAKVEERNGVVHLAELMEEQNEENEQEKKEEAPGEDEEAAKEAESSAAEQGAEEEDEPTPQQLEALLILADLVILTT